MALYFETPQDLGRTLDNGFAIYRESIKAVMPVSFVTALLINLPSVVNYVTMNRTPGAMSGVVMLIALVLYVPGYLGLIVSQDAIARGAPSPSLGQAFQQGFRRLGPALVTGLLMVLAMMVGMILLVIPGVILSVSLVYALYLVVLENKGPVESLGGSHRLVWGNWWRTAIVYTVALLLYLVPVMLFGGVLAFMVGLTTAASGGESPEERIALFTVLLAGVQIITAGLLMPLMNGFMLAQYNDLKLRKSGADLLARAAA